MISLFCPAPSQTTNGTPQVLHVQFCMLHTAQRCLADRQVGVKIQLCSSHGILCMDKGLCLSRKRLKSLLFSPEASWGPVDPVFCLPFTPLTLSFTVLWPHWVSFCPRNTPSMIPCRQIVFFIPSVCRCLSPDLSFDGLGFISKATSSRKHSLA